MQRYFAIVSDNKVLLSNDDQHHLLNVLRAKIGEKIEVVSEGSLFLAEITKISPLVISVVNKLEDNSELKAKVTLYYCLSKGDKNDFVVQKATELGASKIVLVSSKRCVVKYDNKDVDKKIARFNKIAKEAAEQCHRIIVPEIIGPVTVDQIGKIATEEVRFVAYEEEAKKSPSFSLEGNETSVAVFIGPEGGIDENEVKKLNEFSFKNVSLGNRILRTETAAVYALSVIANYLEK
ncbi:MAG: 16S rRNA (uracil(1498)-N(3))-methyltransferase [Bacilli bacterium]|nr:16S rRNA (uracil(1498)-N(3))-methyltransferase [Bacilli bacterium]